LYVFVLSDSITFFFKGFLCDSISLAVIVVIGVFTCIIELGNPLNTIGPPLKFNYVVNQISLGFVFVSNDLSL